MESLANKKVYTVDKGLICTFVIAWRSTKRTLATVSFMANKISCQVFHCRSRNWGTRVHEQPEKMTVFFFFRKDLRAKDKSLYPAFFLWNTSSMLPLGLKIDAGSDGFVRLWSEFNWKLFSATIRIFYTRIRSENSNFRSIDQLNV